MAIESEKNAWPSAERTTEESIFEKSGFSKNSTPEAAPGIVMEPTASRSMMRRRMGISSLEKRSMPFCTPRTMMTWVSNKKARAKSSGDHVEVLKAVK